MRYKFSRYLLSFILVAASACQTTQTSESVPSDQPKRPTVHLPLIFFTELKNVTPPNYKQSIEIGAIQTGGFDEASLRRGMINGLENSNLYAENESKAKFKLDIALKSLTFSQPKKDEVLGPVEVTFTLRNSPAATIVEEKTIVQEKSRFVAEGESINPLAVIFAVALLGPAQVISNMNSNSVGPGGFDPGSAYGDQTDKTSHNLAEELIANAFNEFATFFSN